MAVTVLAVVFLVFMVVVAIGGYKLLGKRALKPEEINTEKCSICRERFEKIQLLERQIGDYRLLYFCKKCVMGLFADLVIKN